MDDVPDLDVFMVCRQVATDQLTSMPDGYSMRSMRADELDVWKAFPFDTPADVAAYDGFMSDFFERAYAARAEEFFAATTFVCDEGDRPIATCGIFGSYDGTLTTVQWFKVLRSHEGRGIGRALMSELLRAVPPSDFPIHLHTQPGSVRAIKLYSDLGFDLIAEDLPGPRPNQYAAAMVHLERTMPPADFARLRTAPATPELRAALDRFDTIEF